MTVFSINTLSCRLVPVNTSSSTLVPCPKGREPPGGLHFSVPGSIWRAPATFQEHLRLPSSILLCHEQTTHLLAKDAHRLWYRTERFLLSPAGYNVERHTVHPQEPILPFFPARDTAREQIEYLCLSKKTCSAPRVLPALSTQPSSWCFKLLLLPAASVVGRFE